MVWEKLNKFASISKFKSLSEATREGKFSQSTWSRDIALLERVFGARLISRDFNGVELTEKGKSLIQIIESFKNNLQLFKSTN